MPGDGFAYHPVKKDLRIDFTEETHSYEDSYGREYTSATRLIHSAFPEFYAEETAARLAAERGTTAEAIRQEWQERARKGTRAHENCEYQLLGEYEKMHAPEDAEEQDRFAAAWEEVELIKSAGFSVMEPEKLVFSPRFRVSGSIDLFAEHPEGWYMLLDWKYIRKLHEKSFSGEKGIIPPTEEMENCNKVHYTLQLNIYEQILKQEGYIKRGAFVQKVLNVYDSKSRRFIQYSVENMDYTALELLAYNATGSVLEVPF